MNKKMMVVMVLVLLSFSVTAGFWDDFFGKNVAGSAIEDCSGFWDCWFNGGENLVVVYE
jgi:hypothetical protein